MIQGFYITWIKLLSVKKEIENLFQKLREDQSSQTSSREKVYKFPGYLLYQQINIHDKIRALGREANSKPNNKMHAQQASKYRRKDFLAVEAMLSQRETTFEESETSSEVFD